MNKRFQERQAILRSGRKIWLKIQHERFQIGERPETFQNLIRCVLTVFDSSAEFHADDCHWVFGLWVCRL